jgi:hypothetical protein
MDAILHIIKSWCRKRTNRATTQNDRCLVNEQFIDQSLLNQGSAQCCPGFNLDLVATPLRQFG